MFDFFNVRRLLLKTLLFFTFLLIFASPLASTVHAILPADGNLGGGTSSTSEGGIGTIDDKKLGVPTDINGVIGGLVQLVYAVAGILFFFMFLLGGIRYITAGGDEKAATAARATLTQAVIGLVIVVAAFLITQLLFTLFGIKGFIKIG